MQLSSGSEACVELTEAQKMVQFQLRHGNDLLAMDSLKDCDVSSFLMHNNLTYEMYLYTRSY